MKIIDKILNIGLYKTQYLIILKSKGIDTTDLEWKMKWLA